MNWLKDHVFLTGWLALPFTVWSAITKLRKKDGQPLDFTWAIIIMTFGISLGITFRPALDQFSRESAKHLAMMSSFAILFARPRLLC